MTIGFVRQLLTLKEQDPVLTAFGVGVVAKILYSDDDDDDSDDGDNDNGSDDGGSSWETIIKTTFQIQLSYGTLYAVDEGSSGGSGTGGQHHHRATHVVSSAAVLHKIITPDQYNQAIAKLEEYRTMQLEIQCQEELNIPFHVGSNSGNGNTTTTTTTTGGGGGSSNKDSNNNSNNSQCCVGCLFNKEENTTTTSTTATTSTGGGTGNTTSSSYKEASSTTSANTNKKKQRSGLLLRQQRKAEPCDVCGNPVCQYHKEVSSSSADLFTICLDCSRDLDSQFDNIYDQQLYDTVIRLMNSYDRMMIQLSFCAPLIPELAVRLSSMDKNKSRMSIGTSGLSFVSGALGIAGAATILTPAGLPLLIAAIATSGSAATVQGGYSMAIQTSSKEANKLADRIVGWHGLCYKILTSLETLRQELVHVQEQRLLKEQRIQQQQNQQQQKALSPKSAMYSTSSASSASAAYADSASRVSSMGAKVTSVVGTAGAASSNFTPMLQTSLQMTPIVGAVLSVGVMALDSHTIANTLIKLQQPHAMAVMLGHIQRSFCSSIPTSVESIAITLLQAVRELKQKVDNDLRIYEEAFLCTTNTTSGSGSYDMVDENEGKQEDNIEEDKKEEEEAGVVSSNNNNVGGGGIAPSAASLAFASFLAETDDDDEEEGKGGEDEETKMMNSSSKGGGRPVVNNTETKADDDATTTDATVLIEKKQQETHPFVVESQQQKTNAETTTKVDEPCRTS